MPDPILWYELDDDARTALIAEKVMGWHLGRQWYPETKGKPGYTGWPVWRESPDDEGWIEDVNDWQPLHDPAAWWAVVREMGECRKKGVYKPTFELQWYEHDEEGEAAFIGVKGGGERWSHRGFYSPGELVCVAALRALGFEVVTKKEECST